MYSYDLNMNLANIQNKLADQVIKEDDFKELKSIAGVYASFSQDNWAVAAAVLINLKDLEIIETIIREVELLFPYKPGFLGFREANAMVSTLNDLTMDYDVVMVNGHGVLHPRGFGLASHVGLMIDKATLGVAKRLIVGSHIIEGKHIPELIFFRNEILGVYLNGFYVSIGHKISLKTALKLVNNTSIFKTPEPIRQAHILATRAFKEILKITI
jgi:deoxyribonuclease V